MATALDRSTLVGSPTFTTGRFGKGLASADASNYISLPAGTLPPAPFTIELWMKKTDQAILPAINFGAAGDNGTGVLWLGSWNSGHVAAYVPGLSTNDDTGAAFCDGNWHHLALVVTTTGAVTYLDGVAVQTLTGTPGTASASSGVMGYYVGGGFPYSGSQAVVDEVAIWPTARYTANFTPPAAAYAGTEGMSFLSHLEGPGIATVNVAPNDPGIVYSPYNWQVTGGAARTICAGAALRTIFSGTSVGLITDTSATVSPYPQVYTRVDRGAWQEVTLGPNSPTIQVATGLPSRKHLLEVVMKSSSEFVNRWPTDGTEPQSVLAFTGIQVDQGTTLSAPRKRTFNAIIYGDSITEGYKSMADTELPDGSNVWGSYAGVLAEKLDAEVGIVGFGGLAVTHVDGAIPAFPDQFNLIMPGVTRSFTAPPPDFVIYNMGTNDGADTSSGMEQVIRAILAAAPNSRHLLIVPFNGNRPVAELQSIAAACGPNVSVIDTTGWFNTADSSDGLHPWDYASADLAARLLPLIQAKVYPGGRSYRFS